MCSGVAQHTDYSEDTTAPDDAADLDNDSTAPNDDGHDSTAPDDGHHEGDYSEVPEDTPVQDVPDYPDVSPPVFVVNPCQALGPAGPGPSRRRLPSSNNEVTMKTLEL